MIGITLGDAVGIGPEVALKALDQLSFKAFSKILCLGPRHFYEALAHRFKLKRAAKHFGSRVLFDESVPVPSKIAYGRADKKLARLAVASIERAASLAMAGKISAVVTPPINKAAIQEAGFKIPGHTEYLAKLSKTKRFEMMLAGGPLRVVLVTRHEPIRSVAQQLTSKRIIEAILLTDLELRKSFGIQKPVLAVCGLNPHAGEMGHIGTEELRLIEPAVRKAQSLVRSRLVGPLPPDTVFYRALAGEFDAEICMYHDQGLIPLKMISRGAGVNVTLGLPFVRTSPDHGTAYDIAGKGAADAGSMLEALKLAYKLARQRRVIPASFWRESN